MLLHLEVSYLGLEPSASLMKKSHEPLQLASFQNLLLSSMTGSSMLNVEGLSTMFDVVYGDSVPLPPLVTSS
jgi:hypothetical protein